MFSPQMVFVILACICFFLAFVNRPVGIPVEIGWLGLFFLALTFLFR